MAKIFSEDAYCLGLLYSYIYSGRTMMLLEDLKNFHKMIERNLIDTDVMDINAASWYDEQSIYYQSEGKNGELYYALFPNFNLNKAELAYIGSLSPKVLVASQKENALNCLGLQKKDGTIKRKDINSHIDMISVSTFMKKFLEKLKSGQIEMCFKTETELTEEHIVQQLEICQKLLDTDIINEETTEQEPVKELVIDKK